MASINKPKGRNWIYLLPFIGDFANSLLLVQFIFYGVSVGFTTVQIGWITSTYGLIYLIFPPIMGKISDRISRKSSLIIATTVQILLAISYMGEFLWIADSLSLFWLIIIGQMLRAVAYAFYWPSIQALLSELSHHSGVSHEKNISFFCISWSAGQALGPLVAGLVAEFSLILGFGIVTGVYVIGFVVVFFALPKLHPHTIPKTNPNPALAPTLNTESNLNPNPDRISELTPRCSPKKTLRSKFTSLPAILLVGTLAFAFGSKIMSGYFPNYAVLVNGLAWSESQTGVAIFIFGAGQFLAYVLGSFFRNSLRLLYLSLLAIALLYLPLVYVTGIFPVSLILFGLGLAIGTTYFVSLELTLKSESSGKGAKAGWFESMVGLGTGIAPLIAGKLAEIRLTTPFLFVSIVCGVLLGTMIVLVRIRNKSK